MVVGSPPPPAPELGARPQEELQPPPRRQHYRHLHAGAESELPLSPPLVVQASPVTSHASGMTDKTELIGQPSPGSENGRAFHLPASAIAGRGPQALLATMAEVDVEDPLPPRRVEVAAAALARRVEEASKILTHLSQQGRQLESLQAEAMALERRYLQLSAGSRGEGWPAASPAAQSATSPLWPP